MAADGAVVCDASTLAAMVFEEPGWAEARLLTRSKRLYAPPLLRYEMAQATVNKCVKRPEEAAWVLRAFAAALRVPIRFVEPSWLKVVDLAREHDLTAYDAAYLQLAVALNIRLATLDRRLAAAAQTLGAGATAQ
jgi:predicted nucleic acid-binding protein